MVAPDSVPQLSFEQATLQLTPLFAESFVTVAVKSIVPPATTVCAVLGCTATETTGAGVMVRVTLALLDASVFDVAVTKTERFAVNAGGAVYVTDVPAALESVPQLSCEQVTVHTRPALELSFATEAVSDMVPPAATVCDAGGAMVTTIEIGVTGVV